VQVDLICIGTELLTGLVENTNAGYISRRLWSRGIPVREQRVVPDSVPAIMKALQESLDSSEAVICVGGWDQPTMISPGRRSQSCYNALYLSTGSGCSSWSGTSPGGAIPCRRETVNRPWLLREAAYCIIPRDGSGSNYPCRGVLDHSPTWPPEEMKPLFEEEVLPFLEAQGFRTGWRTKIIRTAGCGESFLKRRLSRPPCPKRCSFLS